MDQTDVSRQSLGRKGSNCVGKLIWWKYKQKRYLQWALKELLGLINGNIQETGEFFPIFLRRRNSIPATSQISI